MTKIILAFFLFALPTLAQDSGAQPRSPPQDAARPKPNST